MQAAIYGRLAFDPRSLTTSTGKPMASARVAVDVSGKDGEETLWLDLLAFGAQAEILVRHAKGDMVSGTGRLTKGRYRSHGGDEREQWTLIADSLVSARTVRPLGRRVEKDTRSASFAAQAPADGGFDDAIPF